ncbi:hypothetical protein CBM2634_B60050 [Cupriavidus taiwanensis]|uniref:Uncharacterized protein n=1 Tax=Cupriavidus taiwanensis TaxID=164546 RepID=A0A375J8V9_9BURK|nr:hypothetical protein CBM2634_B60050 [Cupriavidus taiwanensis]
MIGPTIVVLWLDFSLWHLSGIHKQRGASVIIPSDHSFHQYPVTARIAGRPARQWGTEERTAPTLERQGMSSTMSR